MNKLAAGSGNSVVLNVQFWGNIDGDYYVIRVRKLRKSTYAKVHGSVSVDALQRIEA